MSDIVSEYYPTPKFKWNLAWSANYPGLDRFDRIAEQRGENHNFTPALIIDRYSYGYDHAGNRTYRDNQVKAGLDEVYSYDNLNQLNDMIRGNMQYPIQDPPTLQESTPLVQRQYAFDDTGNWTDYREWLSGSNTLNQDRTHNMANEIETITAATGSNWFDPVHDMVGNMTEIPKPSAPTNGLDCKYDAWNRLVEVKDGATILAQFEYDGLHRRTKVRLASNSYRHFYYNDNWQLLETRKTTSENAAPDAAQPEYQHVWSARYIDAPVLRDKNTDTDGLCDDERFYYSRDANMNVTGLVATNGFYLERYHYDVYGVPSFYDGNWNSISSSGYDNSILFGGYYFDKETGLYHVRHRYLHAQLGRWLTRDLVKLDNNIYCYVHNQPPNALDTYGLNTVTLDGRRGCHGKPQSGKIHYVTDRGAFKLLVLGDGDRDFEVGAGLAFSWVPSQSRFAQKCCCCDKVGFIQIVKAKGHYSGQLGHFFSWKTTFDWKVDAGIPYPIGRTTNPCISPVAGAKFDDNPGFTINPLSRFAPPATLSWAEHKFEVCAVCLSGNEGYRARPKGKATQVYITGLTVYGCLRWGYVGARTVTSPRTKNDYYYSRWLAGRPKSGTSSGAQISLSSYEGKAPTEAFEDTVLHS